MEQANPTLPAMPSTNKKPMELLPEMDTKGIGPEPPQQQEEQPATHTTHNGHAIRHPTRYQPSLEQREQGLVAWEILLDQDEQEDSPTAQQQFDMQMAMAEPILFAASSDPDIMYFHEAMHTPDRKQFLTAMEKEIKGHEEGKDWTLVTKEQVPKGTKVLNAVWSMRHKRHIESREIYK